MSYRRVVVTRSGGPEVLAVVEEPGAPSPGPGEVVLRMEAASVSFTDTLIRKGRYFGAGVKPPFTPGYDVMGTVASVGSSVASPAVGDRVAALTVTGGYAELVRVRAADCVPVPAGTAAPEAAAMVLGHLSAYQMLHRVAKVGAGSRALVHGAAGGVGSALLQLGALVPLELYGTASGDGLALVRDLGATAIDHRRDDFQAAMGGLTPPGVDAVFDGIGAANLTRSYRCLRRGGTLVSYGALGTATGRLKNAPLAYAGVFIRGWLPGGGSTRLYSIASMKKKHPDWYREDLSTLFALLAAGRVRPVVSHVLPLDRAREAHEMLEGRGVLGRIVLVPDGGDATA